MAARAQQLSGFDPSGQLRSPASAEVGTLAAAGQTAIAVGVLSRQALVRGQGPQQLGEPWMAGINAEWCAS